MLNSEKPRQAKGDQCFTSYAVATAISSATIAAMITRRSFLKCGAAAGATLALPWTVRQAFASQTSAQLADQVYPAAAVAGRGNRGRDTKRNESVRVHAEGNCTTTASQPATDAVLGVRRWLGTWRASRFVWHGGGRAKRYAA